MSVVRRHVPFERHQMALSYACAHGDRLHRLGLSLPTIDGIPEEKLAWDETIWNKSSHVRRIGPYWRKHACLACVLIEKKYATSKFVSEATSNNNGVKHSFKTKYQPLSSDDILWWHKGCLQPPFLAIVSNFCCNASSITDLFFSWSFFSAPRMLVPPERITANVP